MESSLKKISRTEDNVIYADFSNPKVLLLQEGSVTMEERIKRIKESIKRLQEIIDEAKTLAAKRKE